MKKFKNLAILLLALALLSGLACTETYSLGSAVTLTGVTYEKGEEVTLEADAIILLGVDDDDKVVAYAAEQLIRLDREALSAVNEQLASVTLPLLSDIETVERGDNSDAVKDVQEALIQLGYLEGSADGSFGSMTRKAVSSFQDDYNLPDSGKADAVTRLMLAALTGEGAEDGISAVDDGAWIATLAEKAGADLSALEGQGLFFEYDDISGSGFIGNGGALSFTAGESAGDLNSYAFTMEAGFNVATDAKGVVTVKPGLNIVSESVRRPLMQSIILKSGDLRSTIKVTNAAASLAGSLSREQGTFVLNADACALLAQCQEAGELKIRVQGKYESYDFEVTQESLAKLAQIGAIGAALLAG